MNPMEEMQATQPARKGEKMMPGPNAPDEKPEGSPTDALSMVQEALFNVSQAVSGGNSPIPPEAQKHLQAALGEYNAFMQIAGEAMGLPMAKVGQGTMGPQGVEVAGSRNSVPADMPMGKGVKPVPA